MEWTFGIFLLAFLSLLAVIFNWLLNPVKENQARIESKMDRLESDFKHLETKVKTDFKQLETEVKTDFKQLETEVKTDFKRLETEFKADFRRLESKMDQFLSFQKT